MALKAQKTAPAGRLIGSHPRFHCREGTSATRGCLLLDPNRFSGRSLRAGLAELMRKTRHKVAAVAVATSAPQSVMQQCHRKVVRWGRHTGEN